MTSGDGFEGRLQIGEGLHPVDLCGGDQVGDAGPGAAALVVSGEECVLSRQGDGTDQVLDGVGDDLDAAVVEEGLQTGPLAMGVGQLLAQARLGRDPKALCLQPVAKLGDEGRAAGLAC